MKTLKNIVFVTLPTLLILWLILELFFRFVLHGSEQPDYVFDDEYKIVKYSSLHNTEGQYTIGKTCERLGKWSINNEGWNSPINYTEAKEGKRIAVIGDSYVEAFQVDNDKNLGRIAAQQLPGYEVYTFGISGAPLSQYAHIAQYASKKFDPDIIVINVVHNDFDESISEFSSSPFFSTVSVHDTYAVKKEPTPYSTSTRTRWLKKSALARYLVNNLNVMSIGAGKARKKNAIPQPVFNANANVTRLTENKEKIQAMLHFVMKDLQTNCPGKRIIFMMDGPRYDIYENKTAESNILFLNHMLAATAEEYHFEVIDLTNLFDGDYKLHRQHFSFKTDGHWNEYGHQLAGDTLATYLKTHSL